MKSAIVTGATGFLGRWLVRGLLKSDISVTAVIRPGSANCGLLPEDRRLETVECAMDDYKKLPEQISRREDCVWYHLAWAGVSGASRSSLTVQLANIRASRDAVEAAAAMECGLFIGLGTIMEEESALASAADGSRPGPGYLYGEAKHFARLLTKSDAARLGIPHIWAALTNAYGEYEWSPRFIRSTLQKIIRREPLEFTAGTQIYDFIHVEDAAKALRMIAEKGRPYHRYLIGSGQAAPLRQFIETIGRTLAPEQTLHFGDVHYTGVQLPESLFSIENLRRDTGFQPEIAFEEGLRRTMDWMKKEGCA